MSSAPLPPIAQKRPVEQTHHGITKVDNYAWLKDENWQQVMTDPTVLDPEIRTHLEAENEYAENMMADTGELQRTLYLEMRGRIKEDDSSVPVPDGPYAYASKYTEGSQYPMYVRTDRSGGNETILLDSNKLAEGKPYFQLGSVQHSPNHGLLAWSSDLKGSEYYTIRIRDLENDRELEDRIPQTSGQFAFDKKGNHLFYTWLDENHRPCKIFRHEIGRSYKEDQLVYEESDPGFFVGVSETQSGEYILIDCHDHQTSEIRAIDSSRPESKPLLIAERIEEQLYEVEHFEDHFLILTNADKAEDFKVVKAPVDSPNRENWTDFVAHKSGRLILDIVTYKNHLVRLERENGLPQISVQRMSDDEVHRVAFDEEAYSLGLLGVLEYDTTTIRFQYSSMKSPDQIFDYDMDTRERILRKVKEIPSGHTPENYITRRVFAPAHDGEVIPVSLLYHKNTVLNGQSHCYLTGYGSYGISLPASFHSNRLSLVDRGLIFAIAHVRGGKDKGFRWYKEGRRESKVNTFKDFISVAKYLSAEKFTRESRIIAHGGSAGGMLMGAICNMSPESFLGIIADVPFVDVLNTMLDDTLPLTPPEWPEWGNPIEDEQAYKTIASYSPYDNIGDHSYPAILAVGGLTDPRVTYWEPAKWVAKLREMKSNSSPLILKINMEAGHGGPSGRFAYLREVAFNYAFALKIAGKIR